MRGLILKGFLVLALGVGSSAFAVDPPDESNPKLQKLRKEQAEAAERVRAAKAAKAATPAADTSAQQATAAEANAKFEKTRAALDSAERKLNAVKQTEQVANDQIASSLKKLDAAKNKLAQAEQRGSSEGTLKNLRKEVAQAEQNHAKVDAHAKNMLAEATPEKRRALEAEVETARKNNAAARESAVSAAKQVPSDVKAAQALERKRAEVAEQDRQNLAEGKKPAAEQKQIDDQKKFDRRLQANSLLFEGKKSDIAGATDVNKEAQTVQKNQKKAAQAQPDFREAQKANREQKAVKAEMQKNFDQSGVEMAEAEKRFQERKAKTVQGRLEAFKAKLGGAEPAGDGPGVELRSQGADKRVLKKTVDAKDANSVFYVAQPGKEAALKKEFEKARAILNESRAAAAANGEKPPKHLALDWEEVPAAERINGKFTLKTAEAELGSLEKVINSKTLSPTQRLDIAHQVTEGIKELHRAGFVHGDLKPDNFLVGIEKGADGKPVMDAEGKPKLLVTLSDVGKATRVEGPSDGQNPKKGIAGKVQEIGERFNRGKGNTRFRAPEGPGKGNQAFAAETASALKIVRRVVEEGVLDAKGTPLVDAGDAKKKAGTKDARRGFELFAVESPDFIARDEIGKVAKAKSGAKRVGEALVARSPEAIKGEVAATREYDRALVDRLKTANPELADQYDRLGKILNAGLEPPEKRPSLNEVADGLGDVAKKAVTAKASALSRVNEIANKKTQLTRGEMNELIRFADPASPDGEVKDAAKKGLSGNHLAQLVNEGKAADQKKPSAQELAARQVLSSLAAESNPDAESRKAAQQVLRSASDASSGERNTREGVAERTKALANQKDAAAAAENEARKATAAGNSAEQGDSDAKRNRLAKERASLEASTKRLTQNASEAADATSERRATSAKQQKTTQQSAEAQSSRINTLSKPTVPVDVAAAPDTRARSSSAPPKLASGAKAGAQAPALKPPSLKPAITAPEPVASTQLRTRVTGSSSSAPAVDAGSKRQAIRMKPMTTQSLQADIKAAEVKAAKAKQQAASQQKIATGGTKKTVSTTLSEATTSLKTKATTLKTNASARAKSAAKTLKDFGSSIGSGMKKLITKPKAPPRT